MIDVHTITRHYEKCWGIRGVPVQFEKGPIWQLTPQFHVLRFSPTAKRSMWTYASCGMSLQGDAPPIELHLFSPIETEKHAELLTAIAHFHLTGDYIDVGHTVNFGRPWLDGSQCDHGLISLPYLDGPRLEWLDISEGKARFLWLIPVTAGEAQFAKIRGIEALEECFELQKFNYLDPIRKSVV